MNGRKTQNSDASACTDAIKALALQEPVRSRFDYARTRGGDPTRLHDFECEAFQDDEITPPPRNYLSLPPARALLGTMTQDRTSDAFFRVSHERR
jgi:hypothetical protein